MDVELTKYKGNGLLLNAVLRNNLKILTSLSLNIIIIRKSVSFYSRGQIKVPYEQVGYATNS